MGLLYLPISCRKIKYRVSSFKYKAKKGGWATGDKSPPENTTGNQTHGKASETHGKGRTTHICTAMDLCRVFFVARTAMDLCHASGTTHGKKSSMTARPFETVADGVVSSLSCAALWSHGKRN
jgi:hypothetical protein